MTPELTEFGNDVAGTTTARLASSPSIGTRWFDTTLGCYMQYDGTNWSAIANAEPVVTGLTTHNGGGQSGATATVLGINRFDTVNSSGDSALLPAAVALLVGKTVKVINNTATSMNVFPAGTDQINALGASTQIAVGANKSCFFMCTAVGQWNTNLSA